VRVKTRRKKKWDPPHGKSCNFTLRLKSEHGSSPGILDKASAFVCFFPGRCWRLRWESIKGVQIVREAEGISFQGPGEDEMKEQQRVDPELAWVVRDVFIYSLSAR
jgi:hypothetical protein